jgi:hypothetical protein
MIVSTDAWVSGLRLRTSAVRAIAQITVRLDAPFEYLWGRDPRIVAQVRHGPSAVQVNASHAFEFAKAFLESGLFAGIVAVLEPDLEYGAGGRALGLAGLVVVVRHR